MRFIKPIVILVILGLIAAFIWQNLPILNRPAALRAKPWFRAAFQDGPSGCLSLRHCRHSRFFGGDTAVMLKPSQNARKKLAQERQEKQETKTA